MKQLYMVLNAHLDPVWLWEWEEGAAEALSTFQTAADFCEQDNGLVFNHNEALLYQWVEEYDPPLFERIQKLVKAGRWHIMGGWFLQPDCIMPCGESITRQILRGRQYFMRKFGVFPHTAINFDPFGHSRGLVQILLQAGYTSYLVCRPGEVKHALQTQDFLWKGFDGSEILVHHCADTMYRTAPGHAAEALETWLMQQTEKDTGLWLWGIGDHGGGPSRKDLRDLQALKARHAEIQFMQATPEAYFATVDPKSLPAWPYPLTPELTGCYVSQHRVKQLHRKLENRLYSVEKLACIAALQDLMSYPRDVLLQAEQVLLESEFHDVLPGTAIPAVEQASLEKMGYGMELLSKLRARTLFALSKGMHPLESGESSFLVYNPHPYPIHTPIECEMVLPEQNLAGGYMVPEVFCSGIPIRSQLSQTETNFFVDWRKRVVVDASLPPCSVTRFDCRFHRTATMPIPVDNELGDIYFENSELQIRINRRTGALDHYAFRGVEYILPQSGLVHVFEDGYDCWNFASSSTAKETGVFVPMTPEECATFSTSGLQRLAPVRIVESGDIRVVVEAAFAYHSSKMLIQYVLPRSGGEVSIRIRLFFMERDKIAKLVFFTPIIRGQHLGQTIWGTQLLNADGQEDVCLRWCGIRDTTRLLTFINDGTYASSVHPNGKLSIPLVRSPAYATSDSADGTVSALPRHRYTQRMDQGEHTFQFFIQGGDPVLRERLIDREAQLHAEAPIALAMNPCSNGKVHQNSLISLTHPSILLESMKQAEDGKGFILRLRNPLSTHQTCFLYLGGKAIGQEIPLGAYEVATYRLNSMHDDVLEKVSLLT